MSLPERYISFARIILLFFRLGGCPPPAPYAYDNDPSNSESWKVLKTVSSHLLTDFKTQRFDVSFLTSIRVNNYFDNEKFWNNLMSETFNFVYRACYIRDKTIISYLKVYLETNLFLIWSCSTADWDCSSIFSEPFPIFSSSSFSHLFNALFEIFSFAQSRKILSKFSNLSAILKEQREKLCNDDVNHVSVL